MDFKKINLKRLITIFFALVAYLILVFICAFLQQFAVHFSPKNLWLSQPSSNFIDCVWFDRHQFLYMNFKAGALDRLFDNLES